MENVASSVTTLTNLPETSCKLYKRRWLILFMYSFCGFIATLQCFQYIIIADVFIKFYEISFSVLNGCATVYFLLYVIFFYPGMYLLQKTGVRTSLLIISAGNLIAALLKIATAAQDKYWLFVLSQVIGVILFVLLNPIPPKLAAEWFGPNEVSTACGISATGAQIGEAVGMVYPVFIISSSQSITDMQEGLQTLSYIISGVAALGFILVLFFFKARPPTPPSFAQIKVDSQTEPFLVIKTLRKLFQNPAYCLILAANGLVGGAFNPFLVMISQTVLFYCPGASKDAGIIGLLATMAGVLGSIVIGMVLDKYRKYKITAVVPLSVAFVTMGSYGFFASDRIILIYFLYTILGGTLRAVMTMTYEAVAEVTYPEPLSVSVGILVCLPQAIGAGTLYLYSYLLYDVGHIYANFVLAAMIFGGLLCMSFARFDLKRNNAQFEMKS